VRARRILQFRQKGNKGIDPAIFLSDLFFLAGDVFASGMFKIFELIYKRVS